jgi:uncharacterized protein YbcC (UPF0753/DUF2309 family)
MAVWIRAQVARAAREITPMWPLHSFIAVNPLMDCEAGPFERAGTHGVALTKSRAAYLRDLELGRITERDLRASLRERIPSLSDDAYISVAGVPMRALDLLVTELSVPPTTDRGTAGATVLAAAEPLKTEPPANDKIDDLLTKWVSAFLDPEPLWPMPHRAEGFYAAWRVLAVHDPDLTKRARAGVRQLPQGGEEALVRALEVLGVSRDSVAQVLQRELGRLPGWSAHLKWRAEHVGDIDLLEYLAVRLSARAVCGLAIPVAQGRHQQSMDSDEVWWRSDALSRQLGVEADASNVAALAQILSLHPQAEHVFTLQRAYELHYRDRLLESVRADRTVKARPRVQFVACIDPRSEGIRRQLETVDEAVETFGFAGFFGVPFRFSGYEAEASIDVLPALLSPRHHMTEVPKTAAQAKRRLSGLRFQRALSAGVHAGETSTVAPYAFAEITGPLFGALTVLKTLTPMAATRVEAWLQTIAAPKLQSTVTVDTAFSVHERVSFAEAGLRMMGLGDFAPLVVLCGHGSTSRNNLYQSAQHCGACGGNPGGANARAAAAIFNDPEIRALLAERGLDIPSDTFFIAAEHDTVTDQIEILDAHLIPHAHLARVQDFERLFARGSDELVRERASTLPGASRRDSVAKTRARCADWAEVYPEWGLVGNAAFLIGPREMTQGIDLERRVFLHSYRPELDPTGSGLETILTAPVVVAQWINHQYYFSSLNPESLGAGTKTTHNAIGTLGVQSGQGGDLRRGLPWQSVGVGDRLVHEPLRLAVVVEAPLERIALIIDRNTVLRTLFGNQWITLTAREHAEGAWHSYGASGWTQITHQPMKEYA